MSIKSFFNSALIVFLFMFISRLEVLGNNNSPINLYVNGTQIQNLESPPVVLDGHTMVPARGVFESIGAVINWNGVSRSVYIGYNQDLIILEVNNNLANFNGERLKMDMEARLVNERVMIPVRFVSEALGYEVSWDESTRTVHIYTNELNSTLDENLISGEDLVSISNQTPNVAFPKTSITDVTVPDVMQQHTFVIKSTSEITSINHFIVEDDRLVIDIFNSTMNVTNSDRIIENSANVSRIRIAQNEIEPVPITRVVMELNALSNYSVSISDDRRRIYVSFEENIINNIEFNSFQNADYINITGTKLPSLHISNNKEQGTVVIDIPNATLNNIQIPSINGVFIEQANISQLNENTIRIILTVDQYVTYSISNNNNTVTVRIGEATFQNITFNREKNAVVLRKNPNLPIDINSILHIDDYHNGKYTLTLPGDYSRFFGFGEIAVNNNLVDFIEIVTKNGNTSIIINQNRITTVDISETLENIYINIMLPREKYRNIVILDPGHGGRDPGAVHFGVQEKDVVLNISNMVKEMLDKNNNIKVYTTRDTDVFVPLAKRAEMANDVADLFVSIHLNAVANNNIVRGTETYYLPHHTDNNFNITRRQAAEVFQRNLVRGLNTVDRGVKTANFAVLRNTNIPSVLLELGFLSNPDEAAMFSDPAVQQQTAIIIYESIIEIFEIYNPPR